MNSTCPTCGKAVDPLRAPSVGVRDGKVVAYCSNACARAAETKPTQIPTAGPPPPGVVSGTLTLDSGPVIEIVREPASGPVSATSAPRRGTSRDDTLESWSVGEDEALPDRPSRADSLGTPRQRSRAPLVIVLVVLIGGAGAALAYQFLIANRDDHSSAPPARSRPDPTPPVPVAPDAAAAVSPASAVEKAREALVRNLASGTPRVQRVAAAALARTGDAEAIEALAAALDKETVDVTRLDLAYALARAGDKRGRNALVAGLRSARRDVRIQAGRQLALIGEERAIPVLAGFLGVSQLRLGAAEQLAQLAEPRAIKVLEQIRAAADSSADDKARATIALGIAGKTEVTEELKALLADARFNAFAASALARLGDQAARPVLIEQLAIPSLRVEAARALRRLDPALDPTPQLPALLAAVEGDKDTEQVQAAEAILLLAGEPTWSERM